VFAGAMRDSGVSLDDISHFLGHSSVKTTQERYAQIGGHRGVEKANRMLELLEQAKEVVDVRDQSLH